jgi:hypothetical protein
MMMGRPMVVRRRPLLRAAAAGGVFAAGRASGRRAQENAYADANQDERMSTLEANQAPAQAQPAAGPQSAPGSPESWAGAGMPVLDQLTRLTAMRDQGALSDEEFAAAKAKVLGG